MVDKVSNAEWRDRVQDATSQTQIEKLALEFMYDREPQLWADFVVARERLRIDQGRRDRRQAKQVVG